MTSMYSNVSNKLYLNVENDVYIIQCNLSLEYKGLLRFANILQRADVRSIEVAFLSSCCVLRQYFAFFVLVKRVKSFVSCTHYQNN